MNSCILMAEVIQEPQLRYTSDENQTAIAELWVQFPGKEEDAPERIKVVAWGNLANEVQADHQKGIYKVGDHVILEGRLTVHSIDRPEGFKEKRVELTASRIHRVAVVASSAPVADHPVEAPVAATPAPVAGKTRTPRAKATAPQKATAPTTEAKVPAAAGATTAGNSSPEDEIPF